MKSRFPDYLEIGTLSTPWKIDMHKGETFDGTVFYSREAKFMLLLAEALKFRFRVVFPTDGLGRDIGNGTWTGLIGMLQQQKCDFGIVLLGMSEGRRRVVDFSYPYYLADVHFLTHNPEPIPKGFAIFYPFSEEVWATIVVFLLVVSLLFHLQDRRKSLSRLVCATWGSLLRQSSSYFSTLDTFPRRFLFISWASAATLFALGYGATLLSYLLSPPLWGVRTISELSAAVARGTHACFTYKGSYIIDAFLESQDESIKTIGRSLAENSLSYQTPDTIIAAQSQKKAVFIAAHPFLSPYQKRFFLSKEVFFTKVIGIAIRPGFCCGRALDRATMRISEAGLYEKIFRDRDEKVFIKDGFKGGDEGHELGLDDTIGCFGILIAGHVLASVVFVLELITHRWRGGKVKKVMKRDVSFNVLKNIKTNPTLQFYQALYYRGNKKINKIKISRIINKEINSS